MSVELEDLVYLTSEWHKDRNLVDGSDDKSQFAKLIQECGELSDSICKGKDIKDDIGDIIVVLINIAVRNDVTLTECLRVAYNDIKNRRGVMHDGVFIKEADYVDSKTYEEFPP
jgi:NTP pyrophosphatase (non-canonical NTP hydrolase)